MAAVVRIAFALSFTCCTASVALELLPPQIEDLYKTDAAVSPLTLEDGRSAVYIRRRVDPKNRQIKQSLWCVDDQSGPRPAESGEPDASNPMSSPDGKWLVFFSTRPFADGTPAFAPVPPYTDPAVDIWLMPIKGGKAIPLGGKEKPYGRVITDTYYGRVELFTRRQTPVVRRRRRA